MQKDRFVLYRRVRAAFIENGTTLNAWCTQHGVPRQYAERCLKFEPKGPASEALRERLVRAANIADAA